ncbi:MAG: polysaccharide biosynthesis tyrosine autokinase [Luteitalea sp.]|nr:polysaccharide biosynthesis tyrosine autokinase [Luteitalea sp.]
MALLVAKIRQHRASAWLGGWRRSFATARVKMSRIGDALLRASEAAQERGEPVHRDVAGAAALRPSGEDPSHVAPWTFDESQPSRPHRSSLADVSRMNRSATTIRPSVTPRRRHELLATFRGVNPEIEERIVASGSVSAEGVEQYRQLAATTHQAQLTHGVRVVMITSAVLAEGKSLTATNLALTLSESYRRRVLLVDADLRRPTLHDIFQVGNASGLSDGLRRESPTTFPTLEISDALALLPAGRPDPDPMAGLTSARMRQLIEEARLKFDWVVIDTPPVTLMPDAKLLAGMVDAVVLVVGAAHASFDIVKQAAKTIGRKKILGVVLNRAASQPMPYSSY